MKNLIFFISIACLVCAQAKAEKISDLAWRSANWSLLADTNLGNGYGNKRYFDSSHTTKTGNMLTTYILISNYRPISSENGLPIQSIVMSVVFDCKKKITMANHAYFLSGQDGTGEIAKESNGGMWVEFADVDKKLIINYCK